MTHLSVEASEYLFVRRACVTLLLAAHGGLPVATLAKGAAQSRAAGWVKDRVSRRAVQKADEILPLLTNVNPSMSMDSVEAILRRSGLYDAYVRGSRPTRPLGMFGPTLDVGIDSRN